MVSYDKAVYTEPKVSMKVLPCHRRMAPFFSKLVQSRRQDLLFHLQHGSPSLRLPASPHEHLNSPPVGTGVRSAAPGPRKHPHFQPWRFTFHTPILGGQEEQTCL